MKQLVIGLMVVVGVLGAWWIMSTSTPANDNGDSLSVAVSFYPLAYAVERIGGDLVTVTNVGAGRDPHDFQPSTQDVLTLQRSDLVILQGADFEPWGDDIQAQLEAEDVPVLVATAGLKLHEGGHDHHEDEAHMHEGEAESEHGSEETSDHAHEDDMNTERLTPEAGHEHEHEDGDEHETDHAHEDDHDAADEHDHGHEHGAYDPHTWIDPVRFSETVALIAEQLAALDPEHATTYAENAAELQSELVALDAAYQSTLASCTYDAVIISHDSFGYVADRYGLTMHSITGLSTQDMPSTQTLAALRAEAAEGVGGILLEANAIQEYGETLARETGLATYPINPVAYQIPEGEDYLSLMRANLASLEAAYGCAD